MNCRLLLSVSGIWTNLTWLLSFGIKKISDNGRAVPKTVAHIKKSGQKWHGYNYLATFIEIQSRSTIHAVAMGFSLYIFLLF